MRYEPRDSYMQANKRVFAIEKGQSVDSTSPTMATPTVASAKDTTLSADRPLHELEKEIILGETYILQIDEMLDEWNYTHGHHYEPLHFDDTAVFEPNPAIKRIEEELSRNTMAESNVEFSARKKSTEYRNLEKDLDRLQRKDDRRRDEFPGKQQAL